MGETLISPMRDDGTVSASNTVKAGPGRPAGTDSTDTRQRVIAAACRCFAQSGYGPATTSQIAELAGVTAGSVHYHFGSKSKLFAAVCDHVYGEIIERATRAVSGAMSVRGVLQAVLGESMHINHELPDFAGFVAAAPVDARRHPELADAFGAQGVRMIASLTDAVQRGQAGGLIPDDEDPAQIAWMISAIVDGFARAAAVADPVQMDVLNRLFETLLLQPAAPGGDRPAD
ncbi:TetR/AcrR family transcriptional regulator [Mycolicibacillus koreensis]|nr:TetR/AcrR family transcriptional regulator [Mycolicibacillus koreensis]BBY54941.1 TetR family transcriptional regulator [Mycolicibacillus koreensis]